MNNLQALPHRHSRYKEKCKRKSSNAILWGVVIGLLLLAGSVGAYFTFGSSSPETPVTDSIPNDTIPYESPIEVEQTPSVDTVATAPAAPEQREEEQVEEQPEEGTDTIAVTRTR